MLASSNVGVPEFTAGSNTADLVAVRTSGTTLLVTYTTIDDWTLGAIRLWVGEKLVDMPQAGRSGRPQLGQFPHKIDSIDEISSTVTVDLSDLDYLYDSILKVVAYAQVEKPSIDDSSPQTADAWADGESIPGRGQSLVTYMTFEPSRFQFLSQERFVHAESGEPQRFDAHGFDDFEATASSTHTPEFLHPDDPYRQEEYTATATQTSVLQPNLIRATGGASEGGPFYAFEAHGRARAIGDYQRHLDEEGFGGGGWARYEIELAISDTL